MHDTTDAHAGGLKFPCLFPLKVMGLNTDGLYPAVHAVLKKHVPDLDDAALKLPAAKQQGIFDPQGSDYPNRSLTPQQAVRNALAPGFTSRLSSSEKYLSIMVTFTARSRDQLNAIYQELNDHELVLMTL
jgi:putative lipoic acid-binding regulatory protein